MVIFWKVVLVKFALNKSVLTKECSGKIVCDIGEEGSINKLKNGVVVYG